MLFIAQKADNYITYIMNIHTLEKFIEDYEAVLPASELQELQNISLSLTRSAQAIANRQSNHSIPTNYEIASYLETFTSLLYKLKDMNLHIALLLPEYDFDFVELGLDELCALDESSLELNKKIKSLKDIVVRLSGQLVGLDSEIKTVKTFISPYVTQNIEESEAALVSLIFNDKKTVSSLNEFQKNIAQWSKCLPIYHTLVTGESPEELELVSVQNGCIDVVVNLDVDVALDLTKVFQTAIGSFTAYLAYKKGLSEVGSPAQSSRTKELENKLLESKKEDVYITTEDIIKSQSSSNTKVEGDYDMKIKQISELVTTHVIKGNEYEVLHLPDRDDLSDEDENEAETIKSIRGLKHDTKVYIEMRKNLSEGDAQKLLGHYKNLKTPAKKAAKKRK